MLNTRPGGEAPRVQRLHVTLTVAQSCDREAPRGRRRPGVRCAASAGKANGAGGGLTFWLMTTKPPSPSGHTRFFSSMILRTRSMMNFLSAATNFSRSSALL